MILNLHLMTETLKEKIYIYFNSASYNHTSCAHVCIYICVCDDLHNQFPIILEIFKMSNLQSATLACILLVILQYSLLSSATSGNTCSFLGPFLHLKTDQKHNKWVYINIFGAVTEGGKAKACTSLLGPCSIEKCDINCCKRICNNNYSGLHPTASCDQIIKFPTRICVCTHDCQMPRPLLNDITPLF